MIYEEHKAFARAVVALAREHGMDNVALTFAFGFEKAYQAQADGEGMRGSDKVSASWSSGRHGDSSNIRMESASYQSVEEKAVPAARSHS